MLLPIRRGLSQFDLMILSIDVWLSLGRPNNISCIGFGFARDHYEWPFEVDSADTLQIFNLPVRYWCDDRPVDVGGDVVILCGEELSAWATDYLRNLVSRLRATGHLVRNYRQWMVRDDAGSGDAGRGVEDVHNLSQRRRLPRRVCGEALTRDAGWGFGE